MIQLLVQKSPNVKNKQKNKTKTNKQKQKQTSKTKRNFTIIEKPRSARLCLLIVFIFGN